MLLRAGDKLGPYEIVATIGAGGMGQVYRARDARVGRDVAVKISGEQFGDRFEREARAVAALNHPNVCTLYDVGPDYLVMEIVDGEPPKGPLPLQTALHYARQIADALNAAHEKGIIHRDLKPANIKIKPDGSVKVLDFGLAKIASVQPVGTDDTQTMLKGATEAGTILGTAPYMAPEQARGKPVDKRADIWAFGVVFYEMLTGRRPFPGDDAPSILAAVIHSEPRWDGVPANVHRLLESCLQKDPGKRLRDIGDVWHLLDDAPAVRSPSPIARAGWIAAALLSVAAVIALWAPWRDASPARPQPLVRLDVDLGSDVSLVPLSVPTHSSIVISPDGSRLVYVGRVSDGPSKLMTRRLDQRKAAELTGTEGAANPFFSHDGQWVGFFDGKGISKIPVEGGSVVRLARMPFTTGGAWGEGGDLVIGSGIPFSAGLLRVPSTGGAPTSLLELASGEIFHAAPQMLPGGKAVLFNTIVTPPTQDNATIDVMTIADRRRKTLIRGGGSPRYVSSGHLIYTNNATMFAVPFDLERLETRGTPVAILDDVAYDSVAKGAQFDVSRNGTLVYRRDSGRSSPVLTTVQWLDPTGKKEPLLAKAGAYRGPPHLSPDGKRIAMTVGDTTTDIMVYDVERDAMTRLTFGGEGATPIWSRDGRYVVFGSFRGIFWVRADGADEPHVLVASRSIQFPTSFSPDGKRLAYVQNDGLPQIWTVPIESDGRGLQAGKPERFLTSTFADSGAAFSPDGRWLAYTSNESGKPEVYVRAFAATSSEGRGKWLISNNGGAWPRWSPNGRELLYRSGDHIMTVSYTDHDASFVAQKPRVWAANVRTVGGFDVTPDGSRLAALVPVATSEPPQQEQSVVFVLNFFDELRRRAPIGQ